MTDLPGDRPHDEPPAPRHDATDAQLRRELQEHAARLDTPRLRILHGTAQALVRTMQPPEIFEPNDILTPPVAREFTNELVLHHARRAEKLNKKAFEYLFKRACEAGDMDAVIPTDQTNAGADVIVTSRTEPARVTRYSLKTQADAGANDEGAYIQKFMEARWIRDELTEADRAAMLALRASRHLAQYDRVLMLRALDDKAGAGVRYTLWEIPKPLLVRMTLLGPDRAGDGEDAGTLKPTGKAGSSGADVTDQLGVAYRVLLDASVEKVRIFNLRLNRCTRHGAWLIPR